MLRKFTQFMFFVVVFSSFASAQTGDLFGDTIGNIFSNIIGVAIFSILGLIAAGVVGWSVYYFLIYRRQFNVMVKIISERSDDPYIIIDYAAYLKDRKNGHTYLKLFDLKKELELPPFNIVQTSNKGDFIELNRISEDEFCFLTKPKVDKEYFIRTDGKKWPMRRMKQRRLESDYYYYFKRKQEDKSWIDPESLFSKLLQMAPILIPGALMLVFFLFFINSLPEVLDKLITVVERLNTIEGVVTTANSTSP